jgi:hypothetical protein
MSSISTSRTLLTTVDSSLRNQTESPLLHLSGELRNGIYSHIISDYNIYLGNLSHKPRLYRTHGWSQPLSHVTGVHRICRQTHCETSLMVLSRSQITLAFTAIPSFPTTLQPQQRDVIRKSGFPRASRVRVRPSGS